MPNPRTAAQLAPAGDEPAAREGDVVGMRATTTWVMAREYTDQALIGEVGHLSAPAAEP